MLTFLGASWAELREQEARHEACFLRRARSMARLPPTDPSPARGWSSRAARSTSDRLDVGPLRVLRRRDRAVLYQAQTSTGQSVILEVLVAPGASDIERLVQEYELTRELKSRSVLRVLAMTTYEGKPALVFEDFAGAPLDTGVRRSTAEFLDIGQRLAVALSEIHGENVVHRDVKPENILVDPVSGAVKMTGFGAATRLPREVADERTPHAEGSLPYMSPEQTGRVNRAVDSRTDLYSLGVVFFEILTGRRPFEGRDVLEWVHGHVARPAPSPGAFVPTIPEQLSAITRKLLSKVAEDRYQTASGLGEDLARCRARLSSAGRIDSFPLGTRDVPDRLQLPQKLYGRERELAALEQAFARVVEKERPELLLVSGPSGVGKSAVVQELARTVLDGGGVLLRRKLEPNALPVLAIAGAFRPIVREILGADEAELASWRARLTEALGPGAKLVTDLVPELRIVLGPQPELASVGPVEDEQRFHLVFGRFAAVFAREGRPLVLFVDDLQRADQASLRLLGHLVRELARVPLLVIGAYRDNEAGPSHPLQAMVDRLHEAKRVVERVVVAPLSSQHLTSLLVDTLRRPRGELRRLAEVLFAKTGGNPFFALQFLRELVQRRLLFFNRDSRVWNWDLRRIEREGHTDNVIDLMVARLRQLPMRTLEIVELAAIAGNVLSEPMLVAVGRRSVDTLRSDLFPALREGLVVRSEDAYQFAHDRVRQAACSLISESDRSRYHASIGRTLLENTPPPELPEHIFEIVNQLNAGRSLLGPDELDRLTELNLVAGRKAKAAAAYDPAASYLATGVSLLRADAWEGSRAELAFALHFEQAHCEVLLGRHPSATAKLRSLEPHARTNRQRAEVACLEVLVSAISGDAPGALEIGLRCLRYFDIDLPAHPSWEEVRQECERLERQLAGRSIEDLVGLPAMSDPDIAGLMDLLTMMKAPAAHTEGALFCLVACCMVQTSLTHGNGPNSGFGYVLLGMALAHFFDRWDEAGRFAMLGYEVAQRHTPLAERGKVNMGVAATGILFRPARDNRVFFERALELTRQSGDVAHASFSYNEIVALLLFQGGSLPEAHRIAEEGVEYTRRAKFPLGELALGSQERLIRALRGLPAIDLEEERQREEWLEEHRASFALGIVWHYGTKLIARFFAGDHEGALAAAEKASAVLWASPAIAAVVQYHFYHALTRAALCDVSASESDRAVHLSVLREEVRRFARWAERRPENFRDRHALLEAEVARIEGNALEAEQCYERAIAAACEEEFTSTTAIAFELAGKCWLARGFVRIAERYLGEARDAYERWGATCKVVQLEERHPRIAERASVGVRGRSLSAGAGQLDVLSLMKASQSIAEETCLESVIRTLMRVVIEQSVASRGYLLLASDGEPVVRAEARTTENGVEAAILSAPVATSKLVPEPLVKYVWRSREQAVFADASELDGRGTLVPIEYVERMHPRSMLCQPILRRGRVVGALYLENNLVTNAFTPERVAALEVLAAQAAISLEVAGLLQEERRARAELARSEARFRRVYESNIIGILFAEMTGRVFDANDYVLDTLRYSRRDLERGVLDKASISPPEYAEVDARVIAELRAARACRPFEKELLRKDGTRVPVLVGASVLEGAVDSIVVFMLDITDRHRLLLQERQARADAEEALRSREEFMALAAHELRTPLTPLKLQLQMLQGIVANGGVSHSPSELVKLFSAADRQVDRLSRLVCDLLDLSRLDAGHLRLECETFDLSVLAREVVERCRLSSRPGSSSMDLRADAPVVGDWDRHRIEQVIVNLLANAVKYGDGRPIEVTVGERDGRGVLTVRDGGIGIGEADQTRIFERFTRAVSITHFGGFGLGLYICREIVQAHGGTIQVESRLGHGATFTVELPMPSRAVT